jgi:hypothetical protein
MRYDEGGLLWFLRLRNGRRFDDLRDAVDGIDLQFAGSGTFDGSVVLPGAGIDIGTLAAERLETVEHRSKVDVNAARARSRVHSLTHGLDVQAGR